MIAPRDGTGSELGLGLDLGSTALRVAYGRPGGPERRFTLSGGRWPWLLCEPAPSGPLPVVFPSLKSRLGGDRPVRIGGLSVAPEDVLAGLLRVVRERIEEEAGARIGQTVVSVPVSYRSTQRTALLDAARAAGLDEVRLIGDAMAAVIGHTEGRGSTTCLVYGLGYGGFELGLVRGARERCRALGHESAASTGGRAFDDAALTAALRAVRGRSGTAATGNGGWLRLRARVERIREDLDAPDGGDGALLELDERNGETVQLRFDLVQLAAFLERHARRALDRARTLLDQSAMSARDVDTVLLVGGGTRLASVRASVRGLGREVVRAPDDLLAHGALLHASQLAGAPPGGLEGLAPTAADTGDDTLADAPRLSVTLLPPATARTPSAPGALDVGRARELAESGRVEEARSLLKTIVTEARALLDTLSAEDTGPPEGAVQGLGYWQGQGPAQRSGYELGRDPAQRSAHGPGRDPAQGSGYRLGRDPAQGLGHEPGPGQGQGYGQGYGQESDGGFGDGFGAGFGDASAPGPASAPGIEPPGSTLYGGFRDGFGDGSESGSASAPGIGPPGSTSYSAFRDGFGDGSESGSASEPGIEPGRTLYGGFRDGFGDAPQTGPASEPGIEPGIEPGPTSRFGPESRSADGVGGSPGTGSGPETGPLPRPGSARGPDPRTGSTPGSRSGTGSRSGSPSGSGPSSGTQSGTAPRSESASGSGSRSESSSGTGPRSGSRSGSRSGAGSPGGGRPDALPGRPRHATGSGLPGPTPAVTASPSASDSPSASASDIPPPAGAGGPASPAERAPARDPSDSEHWADRKAARRLTAARDLLTEGRYDAAVEAAHAAWQAAGEGTLGAEVLDAMIGVHCAAAMADFSPEHFPDAERWLLCAYGHDPTNARVRELLAERTYRHAERLDGRGRHEDAVEALRRCLSWNPEHRFALELLERLSGRGRNQRDIGGVPR